MLPTAILSILASRALSVRESQLENQLSSSAASVLDSLMFKSNRMLQETLFNIQGKLDLSSVVYEESNALLETIVDLQNRIPIVDKVMLLNNSGEFVYPPAVYQEKSWSLSSKGQSTSSSISAVPPDLTAARRLQHELKDYRSAAILYESVMNSASVSLADRCEAGFGMAACRLSLGDDAGCLGVLEDIIFMVKGRQNSVGSALTARDEEGYDYGLSAMQRRVEVLHDSGRNLQAAKHEITLLEYYISQLPFLSDLQILGVDSHISAASTWISQMPFAGNKDIQARHQFLLDVIEEQKYSMRYFQSDRNMFVDGLTLGIRTSGGKPFSMSVKSQMYAVWPATESMFIVLMINRDELIEALTALVRNTPLPSGISITLQDPGQTVQNSANPGLLHQQTLAPPFDHIDIKASVSDPENLAATARQEIRLYTWGIFLLACGIIFGSGLVIAQAQRAVRLAKAKSDYLAGVSHDLRTPLASMKLMTESLYLGHVKDPQKQMRFLETVLQEAARLELLVERVLFFVRFGQDAITYNIQPVELLSWMDTIVQKYQTQYRDPIDLILIKPDRSLYVKMDKESMNQVMQNLIDNAVKYAGLEKPIEVYISAEDGEARISVVDRGPGIPKQQAKNIFKQFYRAESEKEKNLSGVGLGLNMASDIMRKHHGKISFKPTDGGGATFELVLPLDNA
jgi:signal transduction histidine kinase